MDLAHGFLAQQMTAHDQRDAEYAAERRSVGAGRRRALRRAQSPAFTRTEGIHSTSTVVGSTPAAVRRSARSATSGA